MNCNVTLFNNVSLQFIYCIPEEKVIMSYQHYQLVQGCNYVILVRKIITIIITIISLTMMIIKQRVPKKSCKEMLPEPQKS